MKTCLFDPGVFFFGFDVLIVYVFGIVRTEQDDRT